MLRIAMTLHLFCAIAATLWLIGLGACFIAWRWSRRAVPHRFWAALMLSFVSLSISYLGLTRFPIVLSNDVDSPTKWHVDSAWFFNFSLLLGIITIGYTLWKRRAQGWAG